MVQPEKGYARLFINIGKMDGVNPANLMGFINEHVKGKVPVGRIDLMKNFSFFEIPEELSPKVVKSFKGMYIEDRKLVVEVSRDENGAKKEKKQFYESFEGKKKKKNKQRR
ncbi:ATP-dependent RNA helicase DeaD [bioreactor metagenome]|uniref:ATP-dependent RNA helicase DeaD n=1 Tax=bioreactor metagenome TaxID=1076179 RepID=A0A645BI14_9ZZZZ